MKKLIKNLLLKLFSLFPIKNIMVFESLADFSGNSLYFYNYLIKNGYNDTYKIYWFVNDASIFDMYNIKNVKFLTMWNHGYKKNFFQWLKYFHIVKNAKYLFFDNRNLLKINNKTIKIGLNHGTPIKKLNDRKVLPDDMDYYVQSSDYCANVVSSQLNINKDIICVCGNPRNDILFDKSYKKDKFPELLKYKKVILWTPTFRKSQYNDRCDSTFSFPLNIPIIYNVKELKRVDNKLKKINSLLIIKPHPVQDVSIIKQETLSNIKIIDDTFLSSHGCDIFEFFLYSDAMITDYSGIYCDYLLTNKQIGFTIDDLDVYKLGLSFDNIDEYMPGLKIKDINDLLRYIDYIASNSDDFSLERKKACKIFNKYIDGKSSERLAQSINLKI